MEAKVKRNRTEKEKAKEINILLLGETGAGKSTTLNALANYLTYTNFDEALQSLDKFIEVVSSQFKMTDKITGKPYTINSGPEEDGERHGEGNSVTQSPVGYTFKVKSYTVRVIDTPGIGDTDGADVDGKNFDQIFQYLSFHEHLNAILMIVKGNETRKTATFKYCLAELLTHLHKSVCQNIIFCFTYSRNNDYGPGEGYVTLQSFLEKDLKKASLELAPEGNIELPPLQLIPKKNCFFIDNEAFRFMVAKKQNFTFSQRQENGFRESWKESAEQIENMFERIIALPPHQLNKTITLNVAKKIIVELAQPMLQIEKTNLQNIENLKRQKVELEDSIKTKALLTPLLYVKVKEAQAEKLKDPVNACTNKSCRKLVEKDGENHNHPVCHQNCTCWFVSDDKPEQKFLKYCKVFKLQKLGFGAAICRECGCSWRNHIHQSIRYKTVIKSKVVPQVLTKIQTTEEKIAQFKSTIKTIELLIREYEKEKSYIEDIRLKFAYILNENSVFSHNKYFEDYLDYLIQLEKNQDESNIALLEEMKRNHRKNMELLKEAIKAKQQTAIGIEQVPTLEKQLYGLKHTGKNFKEIMNSNRVAAKKHFEYREKPVLVVTDLDRKNILELAQPMIEIQKTIMYNIEHIKQQQSELENSIKNKDLLTRFLYIEVKETQAEKLKSPGNACTNNSCSKLIEKDGEEPNYPVCHQNCTCWFIKDSMSEQKFLKYCKVFKLEKLGFDGAMCRECGCSWRDHMHLSLLYKTVSKKVVDPKIQTKIQTTEQTIEQSLSAVKIAEQLVREYQEEKKIVKEIMTKFACILNENSVFSDYQYFEKCIEHSIQSEEGKDVPNMAQQLKQMKEDHRNSVRVFSEENKIEKVVQTEQVSNLMKQLFCLKHSGESFQQILETIKSVADKMQFHPLEKQIPVGENGKSFIQSLKHKEIVIEKIEEFKNDIVEQKFNIDQTITNVYNIVYQGHNFENANLNGTLLNIDSNSNFGKVNIKSEYIDYVPVIEKLVEVVKNEIKPALDRKEQTYAEIKSSMFSTENLLAVVFEDNKQNLEDNKLILEANKLILENQQEMINEMIAVHSELTKMKQSKTVKQSEMQLIFYRIVTLLNRIKYELTNESFKVTQVRQSKSDQPKPPEPTLEKSISAIDYILPHTIEYTESMPTSETISNKQKQSHIHKLEDVKTFLITNLPAESCSQENLISNFQNSHFEIDSITNDNFEQKLADIIDNHSKDWNKKLLTKLRDLILVNQAKFDDTKDTGELN